MMRSMYSGVSGLKTHQTKMDVIGNNIANVNTVGFKSSSVTFSEIMYQNLSGASGPNALTGTGGVNAKQIGLGVTTGSTSVNITGAGASQTTGRAFDIKLNDTNSATSFFIVSNGSGTQFTRAGSFYVDGAGNLCMTSTGYNVMGWQVAVSYTHLDVYKRQHKNHYPAIDVMQSISRVMSAIVDDEHKAASGKLKNVLATYAEAEDLINIGAYKQGSNKNIDYAISKIEAVNEFLRQRTDEKFMFDEEVQLLEQLFEG